MAVVHIDVFIIYYRVSRSWQWYILMYSLYIIESRGHGRAVKRHRGAFFILQLHDELIYETAEVDLIQVAQIVKREMESAVKLYVKLKAKVKVGPSWGNLQDLDI
uniref:DNA-directed DNA polymerase family A palm domain-containing protein n=1 Tax=Hucho hucho TaxID=62062 RepID=A0A4W5LSI0_9TELE